MDPSLDDALTDTSPLTHPPNSPSSVLHLPPTYLDAFIPGYSLLAQALLDFTGIDITFYVSLFALLFILQAAYAYTITPLTSLILQLLTSHIYIDEYDDIYDQLLKWVRAHRLMADLRALKAESQGRYYDYDDDNDDHEIATSLAAGTIFNFNDWAARATPRYEPHHSSGFFYHKGFFYRIVRDKEQVKDDWGPVREREKLIVTVLWRSTRPIKALIEEAREFYLGSRTSRTRIYRPVAREERSSNNEWHVVAVRPSRPVSTVVLDDAPKAQILLDLNEFLAPQTAKWYSSRGIPYRRGYLFHGPPGTGKSSMSSSLAGLFGLNIYCLSLSEVTLTEEALILLFNTLPKRCIVLLEDIDSTGVSRPKAPGREEGEKKRKKKRSKREKKRKVASTDSSSEGDEVAVRPGGQKKLTNAISISGLLNAIDGVASQEGRILIMTTNHPERLDHALVRPGRVDMQIKFDLASSMQIKELFLRMYKADEAGSARQPTSVKEVMPHMDLDALIERDVEEAEMVVSAEKGMSATVLPAAEAVVKAKFKAPFDAKLEELAQRFGDELPGNTFSPAEVQGFLLTRKNKPRRAVMEIAAWREEVLAKRKLVKEQKGGEVDGKGEKDQGPSDKEDVEGSRSNDGHGKPAVVNGTNGVNEVHGVAKKVSETGVKEVNGVKGRKTDKANGRKAKPVRCSDDFESDSDSGSGSDAGSDSDSA